MLLYVYFFCYHYYQSSHLITFFFYKTDEVHSTLHTIFIKGVWDWANPKFKKEKKKINFLCVWAWAKQYGTEIGLDGAQETVISHGLNLDRQTLGRSLTLTRVTVLLLNQGLELVSIGVDSLVWAPTF
jgi:hypothetical protein